MEVESALRRTFSKSQSADLILKEVPGKGRGVFATGNFNVGQFVLEFVGDIRDIDTFSDLTYALQVGPKDFMTASGGIDDYVNHSCDPNTGIRLEDGRIILFALRTIKSGEEITFDYATTQEGGFWTMNCCCESPACRMTIGDFSDLPSERQAFFIDQDAVLPYVLENVKGKLQVEDHKTRRG
jgi:hypothetical protein